MRVDCLAYLRLCLVQPSEGVTDQESIPGPRAVLNELTPVVAMHFCCHWQMSVDCAETIPIQARVGAIFIESPYGANTGRDGQSKNPRRAALRLLWWSIHLISDGLLFQGLRCPDRTCQSVNPPLHSPLLRLAGCRDGAPCTVRDAAGRHKRVYSPSGEVHLCLEGSALPQDGPYRTHHTRRWVRVWICMADQSLRCGKVVHIWTCLHLRCIGHLAHNRVAEAADSLRR
jgi:hypothetical protein